MAIWSEATRVALLTHLRITEDDPMSALTDDGDDRRAFDAARRFAIGRALATMPAPDGDGGAEVTVEFLLPPWHSYDECALGDFEEADDEGLGCADCPMECHCCAWWSRLCQGK